MAASAATRSSHAQPFLIDLTQSDDEDDLQPRVPRKRTFAGGRLSQDLPASHDGFPIVNNLDFVLGQSSPRKRKRSDTFNAVVQVRVSENARRSANSSHKAPTPQSAPIDGNNTTFNKTPSRVPNPRPETSAAEKGYGANTSKRRKTSGAMFLNGASNSKVTASDVLILDRTGQVVERSQRSTIPSVLVPSRMHSGEGTPSQTVHTSLRVSQKGQIQKPKLRSHPDVRYLAKERKDLMVQVLRSQVFKHIKAALKKYETVLSSKDRTEIGTKTAGKLVDDPSFAEDFTANNWKLSSDYEIMLSVRAQFHVDKHAKQLLDRTTTAQNSSKGPVRTNSARPESSLLDAHRQVTSKTDTRILFRSVASTVNPRDSPKPSQSPDLQSSSGSHGPDPRYSAPHPNGYRSGSLEAEENSHSSKLSRRSTRSSVHYLQTTNSPEPPNLCAKTSLEAAAQSISHSHDAAMVRRRERLQPEKLASEFSRPYTSQTDLANIEEASKSMIVQQHYLQSKLGLDPEANGSYVVHLGFCLQELELTRKLITKFLSGKRHTIEDLNENIMSSMAGQEPNVPKLARLLEQELKRPGKEPGRLLLRARNNAALTAFLLDAARGCITENPQLVCLQVRRQENVLPKPSISALLREREMCGLSPSRNRRGLNTFSTKISSCLEDALVRQHEWIDCCGDISAVTWTSDEAFICGATAHSDPHNMQYNKSGNLSVGSCSQATLKSFADHRVPRPISNDALNVPNIPDSAYQTQDPWLYTSVVAASHCDITGYTFTASFDKTVKVWTVTESGSTMDLCGVWQHDGKVNFVVTSEHHERVATASDVSADAIRVYNFDESDISGTPFDTYCGERAKEQALELRRRDTWAYFPATIQWGRAEGVKDFLLVGYSPRSVTGHEVDIPEEKKNSGELCLWNVNDGSRVTISSAKSQNVFEVIWHPTQPCFLVATSPCGMFEPETRTQIRLFAQNEFGTFIHIKAMDCPASDINELTLMPSSSVQCYVTASCTDGNTYIWDTAQGDKPIHVLSHGDSLDNPLHDMPLELADTGVKFASWGRTVDRFYTGGSDGKVKAWNIRAATGRAFVRNVLEVTGGISAGAFSKDFAHLLIGDATGKVHLLGVDDSDLEETVAGKSLESMAYSQSNIHNLGRLAARRPKVISPHPEPPPPNGYEVENDEHDPTGKDPAKAFLDSRQLILHPQRKIGVVQGPFYHETNLYRREAHFDEDGTQPLLPEWQARQQFERDAPINESEVPRLLIARSSAPRQHRENTNLDFDFSRLSLSCQEALLRDRVELGWDDYGFDYEGSPSWRIFGGRRRSNGSSTQG